MTMKKTLLGLLFCLIVPTALADINHDLNSYFNKLGFDSNTTNPAVYHGQQAGFYTGGSLYARDRVRDVQLVSIQLPTLRSGCGGIDLFTGGFSFVNASALTSMMKNIMQNAAGYTFNLALETATPQIASSMKYIETMANDINRMNINSCETAAGLVGSVWPKTHEAEEQTCEDMAVKNGQAKDYADARQYCGSEGNLASTLQGASGAYGQVAFKSGNLAWLALQQNALFRSDTELAELLMSLSGTVILNHPGTSDDAPQNLMILQSLATNQDLIKALLHGGTATLYQCDDVSSTGCLAPTQTTVTIQPENGLATQVAALLKDMVTKIFEDQTLTETEVGLLNATRLPLYKMLNVEAAFGGNGDVLNLSSYADVIATDLLFQYLDENVSAVSALSQSQQYPDSLMKPYLDGITKAQEAIRQLQGSTYQEVSMTSQLISQTETLERMLSGSLSSHLQSTLQWANHIRG